MERFKDFSFNVINESYEVSFFREICIATHFNSLHIEVLSNGAMLKANYVFKNDFFSFERIVTDIYYFEDGRWRKENYSKFSRPASADEVGAHIASVAESGIIAKDIAKLISRVEDDFIGYAVEEICSKTGKTYFYKYDIVRV